MDTFCYVATATSNNQLEDLHKHTFRACAVFYYHMGNNPTVITLVCLKMVNIIDIVDFFFPHHKKASTPQLSAMHLCSEKNL